MEKQSAEEMIEAVRELNKGLGRLDTVISSLPEGDEKEVYVQAVGKLLYTLHEDIARRVLLQHPHLSLF